MHDFNKKIDVQLAEIRDGRSKELVQRIVSLSDMMQQYQKESSQQIKAQNNTINGMKSKLELRETESAQRDELMQSDIKNKIKEMARDRENDLQMMTMLVEQSQKKIIGELSKGLQG